MGEAALKIQGTGNEILLCKTIDAGFKPLLRKIKGLILEEQTVISEEEIRMLNAHIVIISGVADAFATFEHELIVSIDGREKLIYEGVVEERELPGEA